LYRQLEPTARPKGLSRLNLALVVLILVAVLSAILETEPAVSSGREPMFDSFELAIGIIFLVEYLARLWVAVENPRFAKSRFPRLRYALTPIAIIDLLAVLPTLFAFGGGSSLVLRFFRVLRMLRLAKLGRSSQAWEHIRNAAYEKRYEFGLILALLVITVLVSGSLMYWAEADAQPDKFGSIPRALWWSIVTLTTVGYGDVYPITSLGRVLAAFLAVMGVCLIALPTGLFAASFTEAMDKHREQVALKNEAKDG
jgi:voltage-gated potassium channel